MSYTYSAAEGSAKRTLVNGDTSGSAEGSDPVETMHILCIYDGAGHFSQD